MLITGCEELIELTTPNWKVQIPAKGNKILLQKKYQTINYIVEVKI